MSPRTYFWVSTPAPHLSKRVKRFRCISPALSWSTSFMKRWDNGETRGGQYRNGIAHLSISFMKHLYHNCVPKRVETKLKTKFVFRHERTLAFGILYSFFSFFSFTLTEEPTDWFFGNVLSLNQSIDENPIFPPNSPILPPNNPITPQDKPPCNTRLIFPQTSPILPKRTLYTCPRTDPHIGLFGRDAGLFGAKETYTPTDEQIHTKATLPNLALV